MDISIGSRNCQNENTELEGLEAQKIVWKMGEKIKDFEVVSDLIKKSRGKSMTPELVKWEWKNKSLEERQRIRRLNYEMDYVGRVTKNSNVGKEKLVKIISEWEIIRLRNWLSLMS